MYPANEKILRGLRAYPLRGMRGRQLGRLGQDSSDSQSTVQTVQQGVSILQSIGSLFGGGHTSVQNPGGPAAFARWANEGHYDWVASVALTMSGPDWSKDPNDTGSPWKTGYSPADAASATAVLKQHGLTPQQAASGAKPTTTAATSLTTAGITSLISNPLVLVGIAAAFMLSQRGKRR